MLVPLLFRIEVAGILFRAGGTDFKTDLGLRKGRRQVRGRSYLADGLVLVRWWFFGLFGFVCFCCWCCFCLRFAWSLTGSCPSVAIVFESIALLPCSFVGSLSLPRTSSSLTNFFQCGFRLTRFTCFTCSKGILLGCGVFVVVCLVCLFGFFCLCSVSFCVVLFPLRMDSLSWVILGCFS